jgi:hypothetical protein
MAAAQQLSTNLFKQNCLLPDVDGLGIPGEMVLGPYWTDLKIASLKRAVHICVNTSKGQLLALEPRYR